jgi:membrane protease YdiL (CAAX protease family)
MTGPERTAADPMPLRAYIRPVLVGLVIAVVGTGPWMLLARRNATFRPDVPWAAMATVAFLVLLMAWLNGAGWPRRTTAWRRWHLRLWPSREFADRNASAGVRSRLSAAAPLVVGWGVLTVAWILISRPAQPPDVSAYPTTAFRFSIFFIGPLVSGVVEEAAFRGYMQRGLEAFGVERAVLTTSLVFTLLHAVHGLGTLLLVGPGFFVVSVLYGVLAVRTGTVIPGMILHTLGDLAHTYFATLRGDGRLLFAP